MRTVVFLSTLCLAGVATTAVAQQPVEKQGKPQAAAAGVKLADVAGTWAIKSMVGPKDSVVATSELTATADGKGWVTRFPNREPIATRVVSLGGDSIVTEMGPYQSVLRAGQTVNLLRTVGHYQGDTVTGTFEAHYANGEVLKGKIAGTRKK